MQLKRLKLVNYGGIYNGLGRNEIEIDFTRCQHRIILIKGDNGSGKSTIETALKPLPDDNSAFIQGKSASKEIEYFDESTGAIYSIVFIHEWKDGSRKSKGYFTRNEGGAIYDLNPSGNITSCKERIYEELQLDPNYITLTQLSSTRRGIADLRPAERKRYVNDILSTTDSFNDMHKKLSKLSTGLKSKKEAASAKIDQVGKITDLEHTIESITMQIKSIETDIENNKSMLDKEQGMRMALDPLGNIGAIMKTYEDSYATNKEALEKETKILDNLYKANPDLAGIIPTHEMLDSLYAMRDQYNNQADLCKAKIDTIAANREAKYADLQDKEASLLAINSGYNMSDVRIIKANLEERKQRIIDRWGSIVKLSCISSNEFSSAYEAIKQLIDILSQHVEIVPEHEIPQIHCDTTNRIRAIEEEIEEVVENNQRAMVAEDKASILVQRPADCKNDSCPFIVDALKARAYMESIKKHSKSLGQLNSEKEALNKILDNIGLNKSMIAIYKVNQRLFCNLNLGLDTYETAMMNLMSNGPSILNMISSLIEYVQDIDEYNALEEKIKEVVVKYNSLTAQEDMINMLNADIDKLRAQISQHDAEIAELSAQRTQALAQYTQTHNRLTALNNIFEHRNLVNGYKDTIETLDTEIEKNRKVINDLKNIASDEVVFNKIITDLKARLEPLKEEKSELEYKYKCSIAYQNEYDEYDRNYRRLEMLRRYCSPTTGIQLVFTRMYFGKIIDNANRILQNLFGGMFALMPLVVSDNEFKIPVAVNGGINHDDITSMSSAQISLISMIISIALLSQTSTKLNIIVGDEIDAPFDSENRREFVNILYQLMNLVGASQSVLISHNSEISASDCDVILLKSSDQFNEGNIIWKY